MILISAKTKQLKHLKLQSSKSFHSPNIPLFYWWRCVCYQAFDGNWKEVTSIAGDQTADSLGDYRGSLMFFLLVDLFCHLNHFPGSVQQRLCYVLKVFGYRPKWFFLLFLIHSIQNPQFLSLKPPFLLFTFLPLHNPLILIPKLPSFPSQPTPFWHCFAQVDVEYIMGLVVHN